MRWLLNFYRDHIHSVPNGLPSLLKSEAIGTFFNKEYGGLSFGTLPLQFAVCLNDQEIFKLVYSFYASLDDSEARIHTDDDNSSIVDESGTFVYYYLYFKI